MPHIRFDAAGISYDSGSPAVADVSFDIGPGEFIAVLGPSGCGKSTLMKLAAGFLKPDRGAVLLDGRPIDGPGRDRAVVFQDDALFPWASVLENVAFALRLAGVPRARRRVAAHEALALVNLQGFEDKAVWQLSGGQRQRVGLARAILAEPDFLLMDEPLGALDALTREQMQTLLLDLWAKTGKSMLMITHGIEEALFVATRLLVLSHRPGRVVDALDLDFGRQYLAGANPRDIKRSPEFIDARERVLAHVLEGAA